MRKSTSASSPFLLYFAFHHPHHPQFSGQSHFNQSARGSFGDSLAELDTSVGVILAALDSLGIRDNTIVFFTSDNGPSLARHSRGGCAGLLRCGKGTTWEGGMRVPATISFPSFIPSGVLEQPVSALSLLPTILALVDRNTEPVSSILAATLASEGCILFFPEAPDPKIGPYAIRCGSYKAHVYTQGSSLSDDSNMDTMCRGSAPLKKHNPPLLFNLDHDPGERWDLSSSFPSLAASLQIQLSLMAGEVTWAPSEMARGNSWLAAPCCQDLPCKPWPKCCDCK